MSKTEKIFRAIVVVFCAALPAAVSLSATAAASPTGWGSPLPTSSKQASESTAQAKTPIGASTSATGKVAGPTSDHLKGSSSDWVTADENEAFFRDIERDLSAPTSSSRTAPSNVYTVVFDPFYRSLLSAEVISPVEKIYKRMGEVIVKGEPLIDLDDRLFQANYDKTLAEVSRTAAELEAQRELYRDNFASLFELKDAEAKFAAAQADLAAADHALRATRIHAPFNGKVARLYVEEYELPKNEQNTNREVIEVIDDHLLFARMLVPAATLSKVKVGAKVKVYVRELGSNVSAVVKRISPVIDPASGTVRIDAEVDNQSGKMCPGMTGTASFEENSALLGDEFTDFLHDDWEENSWKGGPHR